jgi:hypothetical protein
MPKIENTTENIQYYLRSGGKLDRMEIESQRNFKLSLGDEVLYDPDGEKTNKDVKILIATEDDIAKIFSN